MQISNLRKEIIKSNISNISKFIISSNEDTQNYLLFNEKLFLHHNKWVENIKSQINKSIRNHKESINFSDINNDKEILNIIKNIAKPNNYRNYNENHINSEEAILDKLDKMTDFNDIIGTVNTCSKLKRDSLLTKINNNDNDQNNNMGNLNNNEIKINLNNDESNRITFNENGNENEKKLINEDIIMEDIISSTQKVKLDSSGTNKDVNSLCTIPEQPSLEEMKKSNFSNNIVPSTREEKKRTGNYVLELNNNITNSSNIILNKSANNQNYKPLNLSESIITPKKGDNNINIFNNNKTSANKGNAINLIPQFSFNKKGQAMQESNNKNNNTNNNSNITNLINSKNEITFNCSSNKKILIDLSSNSKNQSQKKENIITTPTLNPKNANQDNSNNINNTNFINIITTTINKINEEDETIYNDKIKIPNNLDKKNYVQDVILLSSTKKMNEIKNNPKKKEKENEKYLNDFEEYEMSDSSKRDEIEDEDDDEFNSKFIPKWALDEEYINEQVKKQNNNQDFVFKSFGNFVVDHLNLNMLFETHYQAFDVRNSTADWRGDDSLAKNNKNIINNVGDNDINDFFPNRKLQFV